MNKSEHDLGKKIRQDNIQAQAEALAKELEDYQSAQALGDAAFKTAQEDLAKKGLTVN